MQRDTAAYLRDVIEACDAVVSVLSGVEFDEYHATRMLRAECEALPAEVGDAD